MNDHDFYATTAQVIPVIFLALAFETRFSWPPATKAMRRRERLIIQIGVPCLATFLLVFSELVALSALASDSPSPSSKDDVGAALLAGSSLLVCGTLQRICDQALADSPSGQRLNQLVWLLMSCLMSVGATLVILI